MILQKIEIEQFGGLKNYTLELTPGFQYLYGDNEAGKSTICAFLSVMFYGLPAKVRGGGLKGDSRRLYMPWGEKYMAGMIYFKSGDNTYILKRRFGLTAKGDSCTLLNAKDWTEIPMAPADIGQKFLGMGEDAFRKSLFISQLGAVFAKGKEDELMTRLSNLEHTGEEDTSIQKALAELLSAEHELVSKTGRGGVIIQCEREIEELTIELEAAKQKNQSFHHLLTEIQQLTGERDRMSGQLLELEEKRKQADAFEQYERREKERQKRRELAEELAKEQQALEQRQKELVGLQKEKESLSSVIAMETDIVLKLAEKEAACSVLKEKEEKRQQLLAETETLSAAIEEKKQITKKKRNLFLLLLCALLFVAGIILGIFISPHLYGFIFVSGLLSIFVFFGNGSQVKITKELAILEDRQLEKKQELAALETENTSTKLKDLQYELATVFKQAGVDSLPALAKKIEQARSLHHQEESLQKECLRFSENVKSLTSTLSAMPTLPEEEPPCYEGPAVAMLDLQLKQLQMQQMDLERHLAQLNAKAEAGFSTTRGVSVIESALSAALEQRAYMKEQYEALRLARETMEACAEELKNSFAPMLNEKSSGLIAKLTEGRYCEVKVTDEYKMMLRTPDGHHIIESDYVSAGTCDLFYFALRLSVLQTLYEQVPLLIMDDTFLQLDQKRQQAAFSFLQEGPAEQILYFSCHEPQPALDIQIQTISI